MQNPYKPIPEAEMYIPRTPTEEVFVKNKTTTPEILALCARLYNTAIECFDNIGKLKGILGQIDSTQQLSKYKVNGLLALMQERIPDFENKYNQGGELTAFANTIYDKADEMGL